MLLGSILQALLARLCLSGRPYPIGPAGPRVPLYPDIPGEPPGPTVPLDPEAWRREAIYRAQFCDRPGCVTSYLCQRMTGPALCASEIPPDMIAGNGPGSRLTAGLENALRHAKGEPMIEPAQGALHCLASTDGGCISLAEPCQGFCAAGPPGPCATFKLPLRPTDQAPTQHPDCTDIRCHKAGFCVPRSLGADCDPYPRATFGRRKAPPAPVTFPDTVPTSHVTRLCSPEDMALLDAAADLRALGARPVVVAWDGF